MSIVMIRNNLCLSIVLPLDFGQSALLLFSESVVRTKGVGPSGEKKKGDCDGISDFHAPLIDSSFLPFI